MSTYNFRFSDNTAKTLKFEKNLNADDIKKFLLNEKEPFFAIALNDRITIHVRKNTVIEFEQLNEEHLSPTQKIFRVV